MGALQLGGVVWSLLGNLDVVVVGLLLGAGPAATYWSPYQWRSSPGSSWWRSASSSCPRRPGWSSRRTEALAASTGRQRAGRRSRRCRAAGIGFIAAPRSRSSSSPRTWKRPRRSCASCSWAMRPRAARRRVRGTGRARRLSGDPFSVALSIAALVVATIGFTEVWELTGAACATRRLRALTSWWTRGGRQARGVAVRRALCPWRRGMRGRACGGRAGRPASGRPGRPGRHGSRRGRDRFGGRRGVTPPPQGPQPEDRRLLGSVLRRRPVAVRGRGRPPAVRGRTTAGRARAQLPLVRGAAP